MYYGTEVLGQKKNHAASLGFLALKKSMPRALQEHIGSRGLWEDLVQEVYVLALEAPDPDDDNREIFRYISRGLYRWLRNYGYRRPKGASSYIQWDYYPLRDHDGHGAEVAGGNHEFFAWVAAVAGDDWPKLIAWTAHGGKPGPTISQAISKIRKELLA